MRASEERILKKLDPRVPAKKGKEKEMAKCAENVDSNSKADKDEESKVEYDPTHILPIPRWKRRWIVAFPVHNDYPGHWTMGLLVTLKYSTGGQDWRLFHFNSLVLPTQITSERRCLTFAQFVLRCADSRFIKFVDVPVPEQAEESNDCGLYPAHFLKVFLSDPEKFIKHCTSVSSSSSHAAFT